MPAIVECCYCFLQEEHGKPEEQRARGAQKTQDQREQDMDLLGRKARHGRARGFIVVCFLSL